MGGKKQLKNFQRLVSALSNTSLWGILVLLCLPCFSLSCIDKQMSVEEAKGFTVKIGSESSSPPPRRIDDILVLLTQPGQFDQKITSKNRAIADKLPPENADDSTLSDFYLNRGKAAINLNRFGQALEDLRDAYRYAQKAGRNDTPILRQLAIAETIAGNFKQAIKLHEQNLKREKRCSNYTPLVTAYSFIGDLDSAEINKNRAISICGSSNSVWNRISIASMKADVLELRGKYEEAALHRRRTVGLASLRKKDAPAYYISLRVRLGLNLARQEKLIEAELELRHSLKERIGLSGIESELTGLNIVYIGEILNKQGRLIEAEKLINAGIRIMDQSDIPSDSWVMARARRAHYGVLADQGKFSEAMKSFDFTKAELSHNKNLYENLISRNPSLMLSMLKTERTQEALGLISSAYDSYMENFGERHYFTQEMRALRAMAYVNMNQKEEAVQDFSEAVPILLNKNLAGKTDYSTKYRFKIIIQAYIDLLGEIFGTQMEENLGIDTKAEAFKLAGAIRGHAVRNALGASVVRAAVVQPDLADLVRKEQDALNQIGAMESIITKIIGAAEEQQDPKSIEKIRSQIDILNKARVALQNEIKKRFPKYSELAHPESPGPFTVQKFLRPGEALISVYSTEEHTYIWAIPHDGKIEFKKIKFSKRELAKFVSHLRLALDPKSSTLGDIPEFNVAEAYELYEILLKPVDEVLESSTDLVIVAGGVLGQLPFSVLPTEYAGFNKEEELLFSHYRQVPWLIRKASITRMPSAASVISLRSLPKGDPNRKPFIGFGDPVFNQNQLVQAKKGKTEPSDASTNTGQNIQVRGIRVTDTGSLDSTTITTSQLELLNRLPDTAEEIHEMAQTMEADPDKDVFLGKRASEKRIKSITLSDRQVVAFATHALLPGDLDGLDQPALALSSPSVTGDDDDGLLTAEEVLKLNLNADWVVLSACNTGAADGAGAEAVSGLGRAFFYAGTRAILVSMWPIETTSARELTTGLFRYQRENATLSRAKALRKSMIDLIDGPGLKDTANNKIIASYAHPLFWAPFILVGDSNRR